MRILFLPLKSRGHIIAVSSKMAAKRLPSLFQVLAYGGLADAEDLSYLFGSNIPQPYHFYDDSLSGRKL